MRSDRNDAPIGLCRSSRSVVAAFNRTIVAAALTAASCGSPREAAPPPAASTPAAAAPAAGSGMSHGDHNPHHGGIVMMKGDDLHYEVVVDPTGRAHAVYFTDGMREDLPASVASSVALTMKRAGAPEERVPLHIDEAGESWIGAGRPVDAGRTPVRVEFVVRGERYWIDLP